MPGVKKLHQESENVTKGDYIIGHLFGAIGIMVGDFRSGWHPNHSRLESTDEDETPSHVAQMIKQGFEAAKGFSQALYFLSVPALEKLNACHLASETRLHLVTKAKSNVGAIEYPPAKKPGRGRPPKKGHTIKLKELFTTRAADFQTTIVSMHGKEEIVQFLCLDLLWGPGLVSGIALCTSGA